MGHGCRSLVTQSWGPQRWPRRSQGEGRSVLPSTSEPRAGTVLTGGCSSPAAAAGLCRVLALGWVCRVCGTGAEQMDELGRPDLTPFPPCALSRAGSRGKGTRVLPGPQLPAGQQIWELPGLCNYHARAHRHTDRHTSTHRHTDAHVHTRTQTHTHAHTHTPTLVFSGEPRPPQGHNEQRGTEHSQQVRFGDLGPSAHCGVWTSDPEPPPL